MPPEKRGPKTDAGKLVASRNALSHGINSPVPVIPGMEDERAWRRHHDGFIESFQPQGSFEQFLVYRPSAEGPCSPGASSASTATSSPPRPPR